VAILGIIGNILLLIAKLVIGLKTYSQAMIADGLNSAGDVFASLMTFIGNKISEKPVDENHPYGHGKAEYIFSMIISFSLLLVAFNIFRNSFNSFSNSTFIFSPWLVYISIGTIIIKTLLFLYCKNIGHKHNSLLAIANSYDHRNDIFVTLLTLTSIITGYYNVYFIDGIVGILISFWIAFTGIKIFTSSYTVLMDTNIDTIIKEKMELELLKVDEIDNVDSINSKPVGLNFLLIVKISVNPNMTVFEGHEVAEKSINILMSFNNIDDVLVHVNPTEL
jgi:cation diffusion facilitator family transporter